MFILPPPTTNIHKQKQMHSPAALSSLICPVQILDQGACLKTRGQTVKQLCWQLINHGLTAIQLPSGGSGLQQTSEQRERPVFNSGCNSACCIIAPCRVHFNPVFNRYRVVLRGREREREGSFRCYLRCWH